MNPLIKALKKVIDFLDTTQYHYMVIGGLAVGLFSIPRQTFDIDIKIVLPKDKLEVFLNEISRKGKVLPEKPVLFAEETGVIPVEIDGVRIDFILAQLEFEFKAIERSVRQNINGIEVPVTTAEDLIIQKCISTRDRDWLDIKAIISTQSMNLDREYLLKHAGDLADFLSNPDIITKIKSYLYESDI